jgi:hypothetical protein
MARVTPARSAVALGAVVALMILLSACTAPLTLGESSNGMTNSLDTAAIAEAITATSDSIELTTVETSRDGLTTKLYVRPTISTGGLTSAELDGLLRVAYTQSLGQVSTIEVRAFDASDKAVDLSAPATELGIHYLPHTNSISYSTEFLAKAYAE